MSTVTFDPDVWAKEQFGNCVLGDKRRTKRLVKYASEFARKPHASTPEQTADWGGLKAVYRLMDCPDVTLEAVTAPHREQARAKMTEGVWLIISDTTELDYGYDRDIQGAGRIGNPNHLGLFLHSALAIQASDGRLVGLAGQEVYARPLEKVKRVSSNQRKKLKQRETDVWGRVIDQVGQPAPGARFIHVCDRGADNFDVYCHLVKQRAGWVIRAAQMDRKVLNSQGQKMKLKELIQTAPVLGTYELEVTGAKDRPARTAVMQVRATKLTMPIPTTGASKYVKQSKIKEIPMWVVETREVSPVPKGVTPMQWVLLAEEEAETFDQCWTIIGQYENRWPVEEYHKGLKTGCSIEMRQYQKRERLEPVIGLISVTAVRLVQLRDESRREPNRPAAELFPVSWIEGLALRLKRPKPLETVRDFCRALAGLGGFIGRTGDGDPGWQTLWRGMHDLLIFVRGLELGRKKPRRCG